MIPYKSPQLKQKPPKPQKLKPIPSIELVNVLTSLCEASDNNYDSKNHILTINDLSNFQLALQTKYNRTLNSFERQLKILGFKLRKYQYNQQQNNGNSNGNGNGNNNVGTNSNEMRIYRWKGKKQLLIDQQLNLIQTGLKQRKIQIQNVRQQIRGQRKYIDSQIQSILFSMLLQFNSQNTKNSLNKIINRTKYAVNQSQLNIKNIITRISSTLGNQLQLYKLLIYKQNVSQKRIQQRQSQQYGINQNMGSQESQENNVIEQEDSKNSLVSIQVDKNIKQQIKKQIKEQQENQ